MEIITKFKSGLRTYRATEQSHDGFLAYHIRVKHFHRSINPCGCVEVFIVILLASFIRCKTFIFVNYKNFLVS